MDREIKIKWDEDFLMFYNVENLFEADPEPAFKNAPTLSGLNKWNKWRYNDKLKKIAQVFQLVSTARGKMPFVIGLSEIQGQKPLEELVTMPPFNSNFGFVHFESMDERGVDVAMVYDKSKVEILSAEPISFLFETISATDGSYDTTRDVLLCKIKVEGVVMNIFVLHLPSKREKDINKPKRDYILKEIREKILKIRKEEHEPVILCGDFNENPDDENLTNLLTDDEGKPLLHNPFLQMFRDKNFSTFHYADGLLFDQILFSEEFMSGELPWQYSVAEVFKPIELSSKDKNFTGRPFRTYAGTRYLGGYSDHFPVLVGFNKK